MMKWVALWNIAEATDEQLWIWMNDKPDFSVMDFPSAQPNPRHFSETKAHCIDKMANIFRKKRIEEEIEDRKWVC